MDHRDEVEVPTYERYRVDGVSITAYRYESDGRTVLVFAALDGDTAGRVAIRARRRLIDDHFTVGEMRRVPVDAWGFEVKQCKRDECARALARFARGGAA